MSSHGIMLLTLLACLASGEAAIPYFVREFYNSTCGGTTAGKQWYNPVGVPFVHVSGSGNVYTAKMTCTSTQYTQKYYTDLDAQTADASKVDTIGSLACNPSTSYLVKYSCTTDTTEVAVAMEFSDSSCTDANFRGFRYIALDKCDRNTESGDMWYEKGTCATSNTKTLNLPLYSDASCGTNWGIVGSSRSGSIATDTCVLDPSHSRVISGADTTNRNISYLKLYTGCGTTGTLPAGITAPSTSSGSGQVSGASGQVDKLALGSIALLAAVIMLAFK
jgi:hypothetical protein